jgi:hypothetical protein
MGKSVVFVSIFDLTKVFYEMAESLRQRGHRVSWITTNELWTKWLLERGVAPDDVLELVYDKADFVTSDEKARLTAEIVMAEAGADLTVNQCLMADRFVIYKNKPDINEYMLLYYRDIKRFLKDKHADVVIGEPTDSNELVTHIICRELSIAFLSAADMRYPACRVIFNSGYDQRTLVSPDSSEEHDASLGRRLIDEFAMRRARPASFKKLTEEKVVSVSKVARATANRLRLLDPRRRRHLTYHDLSERLGTASRRIVNGFYLRHLCRYDQLENIEGRVALYPLHVQPERSIDVQGSFYSDQIKLIKDIRRSLPFDVTLVVKEHPNFLGLRGPGFFREIRRIPNVKILSHEESTFDIYQRAALVLTVTGTAAYEAGLLGVPAVMFAPMYFGGLSSVFCCSDIMQLKPLVFRLLNGVNRDMDADSRFIAELMAKSFEGYFTDPLFDAAVMEPDNLRLLAHAFAEVIESDLA